MRSLIPVVLLALCASCAPQREPSPPAASPAPGSAANEVAGPREDLLKIGKIPSPVESQAELLRATRVEQSGIMFEGVAFDSRAHRLVVVDQEHGPESRFADAAEAAGSLGGLAAVNGGFFTPEGSPLGWVISGGKRSGSWNTASSLGSGIWHENPGGQSAISRREQLGKSGAGAMRELLQAGPMLVDQRHVVGGLDSSKSSARTLIAWDGDNRWWIGRTPPCSLADLARALAAGGPAGWPVMSALNLDGGRSADLWISARVKGGPVSQRPLWNRPVRNFLVLIPR